MPWTQAEHPDNAQWDRFTHRKNYKYLGLKAFKSFITFSLSLPGTFVT